MSIEEKVRRWVRPAIRSAKAYAVKEATGLVKLDAMENPYGWPAELIEQWADYLRGIPVNRYPDAAALSLKESLRRFLGVPEGLSMLLGNGSDELIQIVSSTVGGEGRCVLSPAPGFVVYEMVARSLGLHYAAVDLGPDFELDVPAMKRVIAQQKPAVVFLAYPNNPTGNCFARDAVRAIIEASPGLVVLDEAYFHFADDSFLDVIEEFDNLVVMRTLSKYGLAGLRIGILIGRREWITEFEKVRLPYNLGVLSQETTRFALEHEAVFSRQIQEIRQQREELIASLRRMPLLDVYDSACNFVLFRLKKGSANHLHQHLLENTILVKNLHASHPALDQCLRVTVGTKTENGRFLSAVRDFFTTQPSS